MLKSNVILLRSFFVLVVMIAGCASHQGTVVTEKTLSLPGHSYQEYLAKDLLTKLTKAMHDKNRDKYIQLYNLDGLDDISIDIIKKSFTSLVQGHIVNVKLEPVYNKIETDFISENFKYRSNLVPIGYVVIEYTFSNGYGVHKKAFGEKNGLYYFIGTIKEKIGSWQKSNSFLSYAVEYSVKTKTINNKKWGAIGANSNKYNKLYKGYCETVYNDKTAIQNIERNATTVSSNGSSIDSSGNGSGSSALFDGQHFKYCEINNLTGIGEIKLTLREKGIIVFEEKSAKQKIVYRSNRTNGSSSRTEAP